MDSEIVKSFLFYTKDILSSEKVHGMSRFIQHGEINCLQHCIGVALFSLLLVRILRIKCNERALVRGALLHDYFLYDWHEKSEWHRLHGFTHASTACKNASEDFELSHIEKDIIKKHMWPLNPALPRYKESWIVTLVDKYCSGLETLGRVPGLRFMHNKIIGASIGIA